MKNQKLLDALKTIKKECLSHEGNCYDCILFDDNKDCLVTDRYPSEWHPWKWITENGEQER